MTTPVVVGVASTSRSLANAPSSANSRRPDPSTSGWIRSTYSSIRLRRMQRLDQLAAAQDQDVLARLLLEPGHGLGRVALEQRGVLHGSGSVERRRGDVLLRVVEHLGERVVGPLGPDLEEVLVGPPPEQQRARRRPSLRP